jgi:hypothetical protein
VSVFYSAEDVRRTWLVNYFRARFAQSALLRKFLRLPVIGYFYGYFRAKWAMFYLMNLSPEIREINKAKKLFRSKVYKPFRVVASADEFGEVTFIRGRRKV